MQAGGRSHSNAGSQRASGKRKSPQARGSQGHGTKKGEERGWRQRPLATCGTSGSPQGACSRSRRASQAGGTSIPAASHAAECATKGPAAVRRGLHRGGPQDSRRLRKRKGCRCAYRCPARGARIRRARTHHVCVPPQPLPGCGSGSEGDPVSRRVATRGFGGRKIASAPQGSTD